MPTTMVLIAKDTVAGTPASVAFNNIPQSFTDLVVEVSGRGSNSYLFARFNGDTANNYSLRRLEATGSSVSSQASTGQNALLLGVMNNTSMTANTFSSGTLYIPNYTQAQAKAVNATTCQEAAATSKLINIAAGLWSSTGAITSISFTSNAPGAGTIAAGTSFYLYGILRA
jgi:hypothetical protein